MAPSGAVLGQPVFETIDSYKQQRCFGEECQTINPSKSRRETAEITSSIVD